MFGRIVGRIVLELIRILLEFIKILQGLLSLDFPMPPPVILMQMLNSSHPEASFGGS